MNSKRYLTALLLTASGLCFASPQVEIYGMIDTYLQVYNDGSDSLVAMGSGGKGGSRIGIRGTEDIGAGSVFFRLENGFLADNGSNTPASSPNGWAFQREAVLGYKHPVFGTISVGRQYSLNFGGVAMFDAFGVSLGSTILNFMSPVPYTAAVHYPGINGSSGSDNFTRRDNSVIYSTPNLGGLVISAMASLGEQEGSNSRGNSYAVQAVYRKGAFATGLTWSLLNNVADFNIHRSDNNYLNWGASYDFGFTKAYLNFVYKHAQNAADSNPSMYVVGGSLKTPLLGGYLLNGFHFLKNNTASKSNAWNVSARYDYPLSKRTSIYAGAAYMDNQRRVNYTINGGGGSSSAPGNVLLGKNPWTLFLGMNHTF